MKLINYAKFQLLKTRLREQAIAEINGKNRDVRLNQIAKRGAIVSNYWNTQNVLLGHATEIKRVKVPSADEMRAALMKSKTGN